MQEYECSREPEEALRCFERALALEPKAPAASLFKGMVYLDCGRHEQALIALDAAPRDDRSRALRQHLRGDALHNLGRLLDAQRGLQRSRSAHWETILVLSSKLGYIDVRLGRTREGITRLKQAAEKAPEVAEIRERLMKALVALNSLAVAADQAEKLASLEGTAKAYLRAASIRVHARQSAEAREILNRGSRALSRVRGTLPSGG